MMDAKLKSRIEEALGLRGQKANHAVRFKDISTLLTKTNSAEVAKIAEKVAREVAESYDDANADLSQLQDDIDEAMQQAAAAAAAAANAQSAANNAAAYTDQVSQQVRDDLAVQFGEAQQAAQDALAHATEAESFLLATEANATRLFPTDFRDGARFWTHDRGAAPEDPPILPPGSELLTEGGVGDFIRLRSDATENQFVVSRGIAEYEPGRIIRITARVRHVNATTNKLRTVIVILRADYSLRRITRTSLLTPNTPGVWETIVQDLELPPSIPEEVWFRAGVYTAESVTPDETVDVAMIRIEDVTLLKQAEDASAAASIARNDAVAAVSDAESAASAAQTSESLAAQSAAAASTDAGTAAGARQDAENSASAAADSATTASTQADAASSSAYASEQSRLAAEAARDGAQDDAAAAGIARDDAVTASQNAEDAAAGAQSSLELTAEVSGRDMSVINDTFLISSDWTRLNSQGDLTQLPNSVYPIGRDWRFVVTETQSDGFGVINSPDTIWTGQTDAAAYVVEVIFTLSSGSLDGAGVRVAWGSSSGQTFYRNMTLAAMQAGAGLAGRARTARGVFRKPEGFAGTFTGNDVRVYANLGISGWTRAAKTITFHRVSIRPATAEELGSGAVAEGVQANLLVNYLTSAQTQQAISDLQQQLSASINGISATVTQHSTAIATLEGNATALVGFRVQAGNTVSFLELMAADGSAGSYSIARISASQILLEGSVSANMLTIMDLSGNMVPDAEMVSADAWGVGNAGDWIMFTPQQFNWSRGESAGEIRFVAPDNSYHAKESLPFSVLQGVEYSFRGIIRAISGNASCQITVAWLDNDGNIIDQKGIVGLGDNTWAEGNQDWVAPAGARKAVIRLRVFTGNEATIGFSSVSCIRKRSGVTLLLPDSITSPLIQAEAVRSEHVHTGSFSAAGLAIFGGDLRSNNFNLSQGTGWRITQNGTMNMPRGIIGSAEIDQLSVNNIHLRDGSVTRQWSKSSNWGRDLNISVPSPSKLIIGFSGICDTTNSVNGFDWYGGTVRIRLNGSVIADSRSLAVRNPNQEFGVVRCVNVPEGSHSISVETGLYLSVTGWSSFRDGNLFVFAGTK